VALRDRIKRLEAQSPAPERSRFYVWRPEDQDAWRAVSDREKAHLWSIYLRCGGQPSGQAMVRRRDDRGWRLTELNLPIGSTFYAVGQAMKRLGFEAFLAWASAEGTSAEIEVLARLIGASWHMEAVETGDGDVLEALLKRVPGSTP
jgi:hypothetical protein